ncbi:MAG: hypothetical protein ACXW2E_01825 [Nitrososphaeraceae archaeon]
MNQREMFEKSFERPKNYFKLSPQEQWRIDDELGILDWNGINMSDSEFKRFKDYFNL